MPLLLNTGYLRGNRLNKICMSPLKNILHPEYSSEYEANVLIKREPLDESEYFAVEEGFCVLLNAFSTQVETTHFCVKPTEGQTSLFTAQ